MTDSFFDDISADKSQLGFEYQDLVCLEFLIEMKPGEVIGLEVFDDVHHDRISGSKVLIQVKHSVSDNSSVTNRDSDLWKTIYNWSVAIDKLDTDDIEFVFYTNKRQTTYKGFVKEISENPIDYKALESEIMLIKSDIELKESKKAPTENENPIKKYVDYISNLSHLELKRLFSKITFIYSVDSIIERLIKKVEYFSISNSESTEVVDQLIGVFKKRKYELIKSGKKMSIDYSTFRKDFQFDRIIKISQDRKIDFSRYNQFKNVNTIDPKDGLFAMQLKDIDISPQEITEHAIEYAATSMFIQKLIIDGKFSESENSTLDDEVYAGWRSLHRQIYNLLETDSEVAIKRSARDCLYKIENVTVQVSNSFLVRGMVLGKGLELSDKCRIGWRSDWQELYGQKE